MMFKHVKYVLYGCQVWFEVVMSLYLKLSFKHKYIYIQALFEVLTSEVSYLKSLEVFISSFCQNKELIGQSDSSILDKRDAHVLFSNIQAVRDVSTKYV